MRLIVVLALLLVASAHAETFVIDGKCEKRQIDGLLECVGKEVTMFPSGLTMGNVDLAPVAPMPITKVLEGIVLPGLLSIAVPSGTRLVIIRADTNKDVILTVDKDAEVVR